jgi:hypothetical protein
MTNYATKWTETITTRTSLLHLTRGRSERLHEVTGTPFRAHLIQGLFTAATDLYIDGHKVESFRSLPPAMKAVIRRAEQTRQDAETTAPRTLTLA